MIKKVVLAVKLSPIDGCVVGAHKEPLWMIQSLMRVFPWLYTTITGLHVD